MDRSSVWMEVLRSEARFLFFRPVKPDLARHGSYYLILGLVATWLAGIGRYWDHPSAEVWQYTGVGSIVYALALALLLYLVILPLKPRSWNYVNVLIFVGMTAPPAFLYAVPVERFFPVRVADTINVWFLLIVAAWRVMLLARYLKQSAGLPFPEIGIAILMPLATIVLTLTILNLDKTVFLMMAGLHRAPTAEDGTNATVFILGALSYYGAPFLVIYYLAAIISRRKPASGDSSQH